MNSYFFDREKFSLRETLAKYEAKLMEIENAKTILKKKPKRVFRIVGSLIFEIDLKEAEEFLKKSEIIVRSQIDKLKNEISKLERSR